MTRPDTGMRLTCTSIGDRKMLTCSQSPGGDAPLVAGPATSTRPSAGERTTSSGPAGTVRSGSRKKKRNPMARTTNGSASGQPTASPDTKASTSAPPMNGRPAESMRIQEIAGRLVGAASVPPHDVFHAVLELQFLLLQRHFFHLFGG